MEKLAPSSLISKSRPAIFQGKAMALVPPGVLGIFAVLMWGRPVARPIIANDAVAKTTTTTAADAPVVPISTTLVVGDAAAAQLTLQGRLALFEATRVVAPVSGLVARVLVKQGQMVKAGQTVAMISNESVPAGEETKIAAQQHAETAQEEAARQQSILQAKLEQEQQLLKSANARVDKASTRLAHARTMVNRLRNGEKVKRSEVAGLNGEASPKIAASISVPPKPQNNAELEAARQQSAETARIASAKWQELHVLLSRQAAAKSSGKADEGNSANSEMPSEERIKNARQTAEQAQKTADAARLKMYQLQYQDKGKSSAADNSKSSAPSHHVSDDQYVTSADAARIAQAALQESKDALAQVDSIQRQIDRYQTPVKHTADRIESATSHLENAQRALFDNPARVQMTPVVATSGGVVQSLMTLATEVVQGDKIADIVPANLLLLELRDSTGVWQKLKADDRFMVTVHSDDSGQDMPSVARLIGVVPPEKAGGPALLRLQVFNPVRKNATASKTDAKAATNSNASVEMALPRWFEPGMAAVCLFPTEGNAIAIPRAALRVDTSGKYQVAVLQPISPLTGSDPTKANGEMYQVEWRDVEIGKADAGAQVSVLSGLLNGERIALQPQMIFQLVRAKGAHATVQISET